MASSDNGLYLVLDEGGGGGGGKPTGFGGGGGGRGGGRLFLGTQKAAQDLSLLQRYSVSRVVCVGTPAFHRQQQQQQQGEGGDGADDSGDHDKGHETSSSSADGRLMYLEVPILDLPSENLLARLHECVSFIESGMRRGESVLVNCVYAQSRSAAVVVAYLMERNGMSLPEAIDKAREAQPTVHINPGFEAQLVLFRDLGFKPPLGTRPVVEDAPTTTAILAEGPSSICTSTMAGATYRWFLFATTFKGDGVCRWTGPGGADNHVRSADRSTYRCKACRSPLFRDSNVLDHLHPIVLAVSDSIYASFSRHGDGSSWLQARDAAAAAAAASSLAKKEVNRAKGRHQPRARPGAGGALLIDNGRGRGVTPSAERCSCTSVFTEALDWVGIVKSTGSRDFDRQKSDKISCPGRKGAALCGRKLGAWSLDGSSCSCGRVVKPAIQFTLSRIERVQAF